jgi:hypothetical protein
MKLTPYSRKAGEGGACAVLIGGGDGSLMRDVAGCYDRVVVIHMPGEKPFPTAPTCVHQYVVRGLQDVEEVISHGFAMQKHVVALEATDFYSSHPCGGDPAFRAEFCKSFFGFLSERPFSLGDDTIDGVQGAWHIAMNAHKLLSCPTPDELPKLSCPAISVCPGPSLKKHLPALRELQHKCLIICADTALDGLIKAGITPHMVTPLERTNGLTDEAFPAAHYPGVVFAGVPVVNHDMAPKFDKHLLVPGSDVLFLWMGCKQEQLFFYGQSTGVLSATLATQLTTGPVYLVGHDLAFNDTQSHWDAVHDGVKVNVGIQRIPVPGNNGGMVDSQPWWITFRNELVGLSRTCGRIYNVNGATGDGAAIPHTISMALPDPDSLEPFSLPAWPEPNMARVDRMRELLLQLPCDAKRMLSRLSSSRLTNADLRISDLCESGNHQMLSYVLRSILGQFAMTNICGSQPVQQVVDDCADALRNVLRGLLPIFQQMAEAPICQEEVVST